MILLLIIKKLKNKKETKQNKTKTKIKRNKMNKFYKDLDKYIINKS